MKKIKQYQKTKHFPLENPVKHHLNPMSVT